MTRAMQQRVIVLVGAIWVRRLSGPFAGLACYYWGIYDIGPENDKYHLEDYLRHVLLQSW